MYLGTNTHTYITIAKHEWTHCVEHSNDNYSRIVDLVRWNCQDPYLGLRIDFHWWYYWRWRFSNSLKHSNCISMVFYFVKKNINFVQASTAHLNRPAQMISCLKLIMISKYDSICSIVGSVTTQRSASTTRGDVLVEEAPSSPWNIVLALIKKEV